MSDIESILWEMFDEDRGQFGASGSPTWIAEVLTEKLTSGEAVERAARALFDHDRDGGPGPEWDMASEHARQEYYGLIRAALTAALGGGEQ